MGWMRTISTLAFAVVVALALTACGINDPSDNTTEDFTATLQPTGGNVHEFQAKDSGEYTVKLTLRNLINEEHERAVIVKAEAPQTDPPSITAFEVVPLSPGAFAPATFRVVARARNAQLFVWDLGDDRPLAICSEKDHCPEKLVTFERPGAYVLKLAAVNGTQAAVKSDIVQVNVPPAGAVTAVLNVNDEATRVEATNVPFTFGVPRLARSNPHRTDTQPTAMAVAPTMIIGSCFLPLFAKIKLASPKPANSAPVTSKLISEVVR